MNALQISFPIAIALTVGAVACLTDARSQRIPNVLTFGTAVAAFVYAPMAGGLDGIRLAVGGWLLGTALFLPLFLLRGMGAGDVKLLAAIGAWLGPIPILWVAIYTSIAGGVLGIALALSKGYLRTALSNIGAIGWHWIYIGVRPVPGLTLDSPTSLRLPYALPIFIGTVVMLWLR
jgi:prepilin peptidase CpaA